MDPKLFVHLTTFFELKGCVRIRSGDDALEFVRLRTCMFTCQSFDPNSPTWCEISNFAKLSSKFVLGQIGENQYKKAFNIDGFYGVVSDKTYRRLNLVDSTVTRKGSAFLVNRNIVKWVGSLTKCVHISELVTEDGSYKVLLESSIKNEEVSKVKWAIYTAFR